MLARCTLAALALAAVAPLALADVTCAEGPVASLCVGAYDGPIRSRAVWLVAEDGTFAAASVNEGSGFSGNTLTADAYADSPALSRVAVVVLALNDGFPSDGAYEDAGVYAGTWAHDGTGALAAAAGASDSDDDGLPDVDGTYTRLAVLP